MTDSLCRLGEYRSDCRLGNLGESRNFCLGKLLFHGCCFNPTRHRFTDLSLKGEPVGGNELSYDISAHNCAETVDICHKITTQRLLVKEADELSDALVDAVDLCRGHGHSFVLAESFVSQRARNKSCNL